MTKPMSAEELAFVLHERGHLNTLGVPDLIRLVRERDAAIRAEAVAQTELGGAVTQYLAELDNPAPDYTMRKLLRDHLRKLVGAPAAAIRGTP